MAQHVFCAPQLCSVSFVFTLLTSLARYLGADVWGSPMNLASRLLDSGLDFRVHLSPATRERILEELSHATPPGQLAFPMCSLCTCDAGATSRTAAAAGAGATAGATITDVAEGSDTNGQWKEREKERKRRDLPR